MFERVVDHFLADPLAAVGQHRVVLIGVDHHVEAFLGAVQLAGHLHRVLQVDVVVGRAVDDEQARLRVVQQPCEAHGRVVVVAVGVVLRQAVVDLGVDRVVVAPRRDGRYGDRHAEEPVALQRAVEGHEAAVGPAVDADARGVGPGLGGDVAGERQLVFGLECAQASVGAFLELLAAEARAASVGAGHHVALADQRILPVERPPVADRLRAGAGILGQQHRIAACGVEAGGFHDIGVERVAPLGHEGEELLDGARRRRQFAEQRLARGERADRLARAGADLDPVGRGRVGAGRDVVFHAGARRHGVEPFAVAQLAFVLAVQSDAVEAPAQGRTFGREVPYAFVGGAYELRDVPLAAGHGVEDAAADAVQIEVHMPRVGLLLDQEPVVVEEREGAVVHALDVLLRPLLVDGLLPAVGLAQDGLEGVLPAVEAEVPEPSVGRPADAGDVLVGLGARVDARRFAAGQVADPQLHGRVAVAGLGVLEREGLVVELPVVAHHLHERYLALVEAQVGDAAAVGREGVGPRDAELLLVDPVGRAVDDAVPLAVGGDPSDGAQRRIVDVEVVAVGEGDQPAVGRERGVAGRVVVAQDGLHARGGGQVVARGVGVAVDRRAAVGHEDRPAVGRDLVVDQLESGVGARKQLFAGRFGGVGVADQFVLLDDGVVFAVGRRADAAHGLVQFAQAFDFGVFVLRAGLAAEDRGGGEQGKDLAYQIDVVFLKKVSGSAACRSAPRPRAAPGMGRAASDVVDVELVAQAFARDELRVVHAGVELVDGHALVLFVGRCEQVEVQRVVDRRFEDAGQGRAVDLALAETHRAERCLAFALDEIAAFAVDEQPADQIALVGVAVELERIRQEVVDVDDAAVGVGLVGLDVGILPDDVVRVEFEDVGVHLENEQVVGQLELGLELAAVAVFDADAAVELAVQLVVQLRGHLQQGLLQLVENREGIVENPLLEGRFADDGLQDPCSERNRFHGYCLYDR